MKRLLLSLVAAAFAGICFAADNDDIIDEPINPNATVETRRVYTALRTLYGEKTVSGTVANVNWNIKEAQNVYGWTNKYPALNVFDFIQIYASKDVNPNGWLDYSDISVPLSWWRAGGLVGAMWHWNVPTNDGTGWTCTPGTEDGQTSFDPEEALDPTTEEYARIIKDMDQVDGDYRESWQAAWDSGIVVDRAEMKQLLSDIKNGIDSPRIEMANDKSSNSKWFDLSGRRLIEERHKKGLHIEGGRKVLIR